MSQQQSKSDLDQALSRKRSSSIWGPPFGVVFARRASPRSSPSTLPGTASAVLASPPGNGFCFRFFVKIFKRLFVRIRPYQSRSINTRNIVGQQEDLCQWNLRVSDFYLWRHFFFVCWFHFFFWRHVFITSVKVGTMKIEVWSEQSSSQFYKYTRFPFGGGYVAIRRRRP